ncbi:MAG: DUF3524 domain-containing protein [Gammaproteobacteria bacterium]|nr:DUF3524 domain-containing protein [Gammaproteobacteria bacterium]
MKPRILLLSGYDAASHKYWRLLLENSLSEYEWTQLALSDRNFSWRTRGSSLSLATEFTEQLNCEYDLIIATSMVDLASLRGFVPALAKIPTIVYFHENQFVYPVSNEQPNIVNAQLTSIYSAICADLILFNSNYNKQTFIQGMKQLLKKLPDKFPEALVSNIFDKSAVLPVPIECNQSKLQDNMIDFSASKKRFTSEPVKIVWNHRWEYDKQPDVLFDALENLKSQGVEFKLSVLGQSFRQVPDCFEKAEKTFKNEILHWGFQSREDYYRILFESDVVISTALHDFQGLSLQEAICAGCIPVAPDRVAYPEYLNRENMYQLSNDRGSEAALLSSKLIELIKNPESSKRLIPDLTVYSTEVLLPQYRQVIEKFIE